MDCLFCQHKHFIWSFSPFYASQIWSLGGARQRRTGETVSREITKSSKCLQSSSKRFRRKIFLFLCNQQMVEVTRGWYLHPPVTPPSAWEPLYTMHSLHDEMAEVCMIQSVPSTRGTFVFLLVLLSSCHVSRVSTCDNISTSRPVPVLELTFLWPGPCCLTSWCHWRKETIYIYWCWDAAALPPASKRETLCFLHGPVKWLLMQDFKWYYAFKYYRRQRDLLLIP